MNDNNNKHTQLQSQLQDIKSDLVVKKIMKKPYPSPAKWTEDGLDHINIWQYGETSLGKFLSHGSRFKINHNYFGKFNSMDGFWKYIQSEERDDRIRYMHGPALKNFSKSLTMLRIPNFRAAIMHANYQKLKQHPKYLTQLKRSVLPLECYYLNHRTKIRVRPVPFRWIIEGFNEIRTALQAGIEPDFNFLKDRREDDIYMHVLAIGKPIINDDEAKRLINALE